MKPFNKNVIALDLKNNDYRQVLFTTNRTQLVLMSLKPGEEIGEEIHKADQIIVCVAGEGEAVLNGEHSALTTGHVVVVPEGTKHNIINVGSRDLKIYTIYAPPQHKAGTIHKTKKDAESEEAY
jgi:mannose-6-phosphate isomerase-like protein (cupin superfamily)